MIDHQKYDLPNNYNLTIEKISSDLKENFESLS